MLSTFVGSIAWRTLLSHRSLAFLPYLIDLFALRRCVLSQLGSLTLRHPSEGPISAPSLVVPDMCRHIYTHHICTHVNVGIRQCELASSPFGMLFCENYCLASPHSPDFCSNDGSYCAQSTEGRRIDAAYGELLQSQTQRRQIKEDIWDIQRHVATLAATHGQLDICDGSLLSTDISMLPLLRRRHEFLKRESILIEQIKSRKSVLAQQGLAKHAILSGIDGHQTLSHPVPVQQQFTSPLQRQYASLQQSSLLLAQQNRRFSPQPMNHVSSQTKDIHSVVSPARKSIGPFVSTFSPPARLTPITPDRRPPLPLQRSNLSTVSNTSSQARQPISQSAGRRGRKDSPAAAKTRLASRSPVRRSTRLSNKKTVVYSSQLSSPNASPHVSDDNDGYGSPTNRRESDSMFMRVGKIVTNNQLSNSSPLSEAEDVSTPSDIVQVTASGRKKLASYAMTTHNNSASRTERTASQLPASNAPIQPPNTKRLLSMEEKQHLARQNSKRPRGMPRTDSFGFETNGKAEKNSMQFLGQSQQSQLDSVIDARNSAALRPSLSSNPAIAAEINRLASQHVANQQLGDGMQVYDQQLPPHYTNVGVASNTVVPQGFPPDLRSMQQPWHRQLPVLDYLSSTSSSLWHTPPNDGTMMTDSSFGSGLVDDAGIFDGSAVTDYD